MTNRCEGMRNLRMAAHGSLDIEVLRNEIENLKRQLAERNAQILSLQATVAQMREAFQYIYIADKANYIPCDVTEAAETALTIPIDTIALPTALAQARKEGAIEALEKAAEVVFLTSEESSCKRASEKLQDMANKLKEVL